MELYLEQVLLRNVVLAADDLLHHPRKDLSAQGGRLLSQSHHKRPMWVMRLEQKAIFLCTNSTACKGLTKSVGQVHKYEMAQSNHVCN
jgi:hypothetical protein